MNLIGIFSIAQINQSIFLIARNTGEKQLANNDTIRVFGFATSLNAQPNVPGPTLIMNEGDSIEIDVWNVSQGAPHTIHLHGLDVNQQNDGVPHLSFDIPHMDHGFYYFKAPHAGTYLYHCHVASTIHVQAGMYGLIIVRPPNGSYTTYTGGDSFDNELPLFMSEIDTTWHRDSVLLHDHDTSLSIHLVDIPDYDPQHFLVNGFSDQQIVQNQIALNTNVGKVSYVRLANIGYFGTRIIFPSALNAKIVTSDGRPLPNPEINDTVYVYPGERYGVLVEPSTPLMDSITIEYINMNNSVVKGVQKVAVDVGPLGIPDFKNAELSLSIFPNPFQSETTVQLTVNVSSKIKVNVKDLNGKIIGVLANKLFEPGNYQLKFEDNSLAKGVYLIEVLKDNKQLVSKKIIKL